ncbi:L,D-transpeptidase [Sphingobacterium sp. lm-10]|uniref:L,D-transpeptidase n=1 Tax=Sphingobacterium sp. lm-10 TaxID=2944904 RepID=UPI0020212011|nr:L,D-transpeptidase [Sphingobacterium sp. lm-10]MCL7987369.1 L,D-transpeptidase [Sphingobacterium sp. lm-10]
MVKKLYKIQAIFCTLLSISMLFSCQQKTAEEKAVSDAEKRTADSLAQVKAAEEEVRKQPLTAADINLTKDLEYDKHTLEDTYPYEDTVRVFQWDKIKERLADVENFQRMPHQYAVLQNHRNKNKEAPLVKNWKRNAYKRVADSLGTERWQGVPLYATGEHDAPVIYGRDGHLVIVTSNDTTDMMEIEGISLPGKFDVPKRYVKTLGDTVVFDRVVVVDVTNQNVSTFQKTDKGAWKVLSMNPATSGMHKPPFSTETPLGVYVVQEKKEKMMFLKDGTSSIQGFAPYATRFCNGGYIHGVPVNNPKGKIVEYSWSLGTVPRSHMCVRNASSHAKFVYDWTKTLSSLIIVIE